MPASPPTTEPVTEPRPASSPTASRVRARYAKTDKLRFVSAIDLGRLWERALRRAGLPIAYSEGFSPHPKVSFPDALPLGYASTGEYVELTFAAPVRVGPAMDALNAAFASGLRVLAAVPVDDGAPRLSKWLRASCWDMHYGEAASEGLGRAVDRLTKTDTLLVRRERKGEAVEIDLRPALHDIQLAEGPHGAVVRSVLHHVEPPVRPTEVHEALLNNLPPTSTALAEPGLVVRVAQGEPTAGGLIEALTSEHVPARPDSERTSHERRHRHDD